MNAFVSCASFKPCPLSGRSQLSTCIQTNPLSPDQMIRTRLERMRWSWLWPAEKAGRHSSVPMWAKACRERIHCTQMSQIWWVGVTSDGQHD